MQNVHQVMEAKEAVDALHEISGLLDTGLDRKALALIVALCEHGVNPEALAAVIRECQKARPPDR
jgi:mitotic-spindle organizing protein 1